MSNCHFASKAVGESICWLDTSWFHSQLGIRSSACSWLYRKPKSQLRVLSGVHDTLLVHMLPMIARCALVLCDYLFKTHLLPSLLWLGVVYGQMTLGDTQTHTQQQSATTLWPLPWCCNTPNQTLQTQLMRWCPTAQPPKAAALVCQGPLCHRI